MARTIQFNPTRTESSLRRGILHNAVQREDGSWVWRWARWREGIGGGVPSEAARQEFAARPQNSPMYGELWDLVGLMTVPVLLCRGMLPQSVVRDADVEELSKRLPGAKIVHFDKAGHSIQGDMPVELASEIEAFVSDED